MYRILLYIISVTVLFLCSCKMQTAETGVEEALSKAGGNRKELFQVIRHYQDSGDSLKLKAALFLIENMADKYYLTGNLINEFYTFIDSVYQIKQPEYDIPAIYDAFGNKAIYRDEKPQVNWDVQTLSADFLIQNIEEAFAVWGRSWNKHLTFDEFCEWILPYRVATEIPESWRKLYRERFEPLLQSDTIQTAKQACTIINNELIKLPIHIALDAVLPISLRPSTLADIKFGLCGDYAELALYAMRAVGIPVAIESVSHWGRGNGGHVFNVVYDNDGTWHDFSGAEQNPDEHLVRFRHEMPKVYRETFGKQKGSLAMIHGNEDIPSNFRNPYQQDATGEYPFIEAKDVELTLQIPRNKSFAYLCVFNPQGWFPVAWTQVENGHAVFKNMGPNIVYHAAYFDKGKIQPTGHPFLLDTLGCITFLTPQNEKVTLTLERKNPKASNLAYLPPLMIGCRFQGADNADFTDAVTFHTITEEPDFKYITVLVTDSRPVKYVRYQSSDQTWGNMSEVEFYAKGSDTPLKGKVIGKYIPSIYYPRNGADNLFDGDPLTFFHSNDSLSWGGLELEQPTVISRIRYIIRNDDNGIRKGHKYELFYMNNGQWTSLGKQIATKDDEAAYNNVPQGALYWLRDYTKGYEERIFEVKNGIVIWH